MAAAGAGFGLPAAAAGLALIASYGGRAPAGVAAGIVLAAAGLALVVTGLRRMMAGRSWPARIGLFVVALVGGYSVGFPVAMSVFATHVGRPELGRRTPASAGLPFDDASFRTSDGVVLSGWYVPSTNGAAVVVLHGASSTRTSVLDQAAVLARHGYGVLLFDARGMGRSGGRAMNFGWFGERDIAAAVDYLRLRPGVDPTRIGALGESMGGEEAIGALGGDDRLAAAVAEGATNRVAADWDWLADSYGVRGRIQRALFSATYRLTDWLTGAPPPRSLRESVAAAAPRPVLLIAAGTVADETKAGRFIQRGSPTTVDLWTVPGAGHTGGLATAPQAWELRVISFFDQALRTGP